MPDSGASGTEVGEQPVDGGTLNFLYYADTPGFDPAIATFNTLFAATNFAVYDALAVESPADGTTELRLLESADSDDGKTWTLKVRPNVTFTDGTPFDAKAIKFNWERLADPATAAANAPAARTIESMTVVDDLTLEVVLAEPNGQFPNLIATNSLTWIGSPTAIRANPEKFNTSPVGAGPFTVKEFAPADRIVFERNPNYYDDVHLDRLIFKPITDEAQRLATLQSETHSMLFTPNGVTATQASDAGYEKVQVERSGGFIMIFNMRRPPFDDLRARQAFAYALDPTEITEAVVGDAVPPVTNIFAKSSPFYDETQPQLEADPAKAQALFDELAAENGGPLRVTLAYSPPTAAWAQWFEVKMNEFDNVEMALEPLQSSEAQQRLSNGDYDFAFHGASFIDAAYLTTLLHSEGALNLMAYSNPDVDELLQQASAAQDLGERVEIFKEVQRHILADIPARWMTRSGTWTIFDPDVVKGISPENLYSVYGLPLFNEVWLAD